jgi:hypothetical protein
VASFVAEAGSFDTDQRPFFGCAPGYRQGAAHRLSLGSAARAQFDLDCLREAWGHQCLTLPGGTSGVWASL